VAFIQPAPGNLRGEGLSVGAELRFQAVVWNGRRLNQLVRGWSRATVMRCSRWRAVARTVSVIGWC